MMRVLLYVALAMGLGLDAAAEPIGFLAQKIGDVQMDRGGAGAWQAARQDADLEIGDGIRTGADAQAKIVLVDDTLLQIDEETEIRIETFHVGAAATRERSVLRQVRGRLRATVGDAFQGTTRLEVHIPTAAIGIKGTDFEVRERALWEVCLLSGGIDVVNTFGAFSPQPDQCIYAPADAAPGDPHPNDLAPLEVGGGAGGGESGVAYDDFKEKIRVEVGAPGEGGDGPGTPRGDEGKGGYGGDSNQNREDEIEPDVNLPTIEPPLPDPQLEIPLG